MDEDKGGIDIRVGEQAGAVMLQFQSSGMGVVVPLEPEAALRVAAGMQQAAAMIMSKKIEVAPAAALNGLARVNRRIGS